MTVKAPSRKSGSVELRGLAPRELVNVLDAVSIAQDVDRMEIVLAILQAWADKKLHESDLIQRCKSGNTAATDAIGMPRSAQS